MDTNLITTIENILTKKKIISTKLLSSAFNINCLKIVTANNEKFVVKYYKKKNNNFNAIQAETKNLLFFNKEKLNLFPKVVGHDENFLIINYLENNKKKPNKIDSQFINILTQLHSKSSEKFGFYFDTQIGGMRQPNAFDQNWAVFFAEKRLNVIFETICKKNPMPKNINQNLEKLIRGLNEKIPSNPKPILLHGDLWEGNILFNNGKFMGLIDPGSFYGHNEMEIAYLRWFNLIDEDFIKKYSQFISIDKMYFSYEPIYQLYYSLLNVHLWDKKYIKDVENLLKKIII